MLGVYGLPFAMHDVIDQSNLDNKYKYLHFIGFPCFLL